MGVESYKIILDVPSDRPELGFRETAQALADIIENSSPHFAIGIFGGWGSGKTTLLRTIESSLHQEKVIPVRFSAWRYEKEERLLVPLLDTIRDTLLQWAEEHPQFRQNAHETASTLGKVMRSILAGTSIKIGVPGSIALSFDANAALSKAEQIKKKEYEARVPRSFYYASFQALQQAFEGFLGAGDQYRIVVFIDDLDRCLPQGALEVLESMKLFLDLQGFVFVVALDRAVVEWCIDTKYRQETGANADSQGGYQIRGFDYIKKIFQVPFTLPPVDISQLSQFLNSVYSEPGLPQEQLQELREIVEPHLRFLVTDGGINPREVKRFINGYTIIVKTKPYLDRNVVLALQTISFRRQDWDTVRKFLYAYREVFTNALQRQSFGNEPGAVSNLNPSLGTIPESFLRYVEPGAPGAALLNANNLGEYLYSGEMVQYSQDTRLLDLIPKVASLRNPVERMVAAAGDDQFVNAKEAFDSLVHEIQSNLKEYLGAASENLYRDLEKIMESTRALQPNAPEKEPWRRQTEELINGIVERLVRLLQGGENREYYK